MKTRVRILAVAMTALLVAALVPGLSATAQLPSDGTTAADALAISQQFFPEGADQVVIARDDIPIDSLAGGYVQGVVEGPLILTDSETLSDSAAAEIQRLGASQATILGGTKAVSETVAQALRDLDLTVTRLGGDTRFGTSEEIFAEFGEDATTGIVARAYPADNNPTSVFADSIAAGVLAADMGLPIFLTDSAALTPTTNQTLEVSALSELVIVGGTEAVSDDVVTELESLGFTITRLEGADRAGTAAAIAQYAADNGPGINQVILVDGYVDGGWASGFAAAAANLDGDTVVLLSNGDDLPTETAEFLQAGDYDIVCGPNTTEAACANAQSA